jgi:hypothetical protein
MVKQVVFGRAFAKETGIRRVTPFGVPIYRGIQIKKQWIAAVGNYGLTLVQKNL